MTKSTYSKILTTFICAASFNYLHAQDATPSPAPKAACGGHCEGHRGGGHPPFGGRERLQEIVDKLDLTADQKAQIKPIIEAAHKQAETVRADTSLTPEQKHAKMREAFQAVRGQIEGILTPEQKQKLEAMKEEHREHHRGGAANAQ